MDRERRVIKEVRRRTLCRVLALPAVAAWPELTRWIEWPKDTASPLWELSVPACLAAGGTERDAEPGVAAIFCLVLGVRLVDDLMDGDPGPWEELGAGATANLAFALQAAAGEVLDAAYLCSDQRRLCHSLIHRAVLETARGQALDSGPAVSEEGYWQIVEAKTSPLVSAALAVGGVLAAVSPATLEKLSAVGSPLGKMMQVNNDLADAMHGEACPDWQRPSHNLALLYAYSADHEDREEFVDLCQEVEDAEALARAQEILLRCGAVSYCAYQLLELHRVALAAVRAIALKDSSPLERRLDRQLKPLEGILEAAGAPSVEVLRAEARN